MVRALLSASALLLASPLEAARVSEHNQNKKWFGGANCDQLQERFEGRVNQTQAAVQGEMDMQGSTRALLRTWGMVRTLTRANQRECEWAVGQQFDTSGLASVTETTLANNPCLSEAQAAMASAETMEEPERSTAFMNAMQILLTPPGETCRTVTDADLEDGDEVDAAEQELLSDPDGAIDSLEEGGDEMAELLTEAAMQANNGNSLAQIDQGVNGEWGWGHFRPQNIGRHVLAPIGRFFVAGFEFASANVPVYPGAVASLGEYFVFGIGVIVWMIIFTMLCTVAAHVVALVLGAVLCMFRWFFNIIIARPLRGTLPVCLYQWGRNVQSTEGFRYVAATTCSAVSVVPLITAR